MLAEGTAACNLRAAGSVYNRSTLDQMMQMCMKVRTGNATDEELVRLGEAEGDGGLRLFTEADLRSGGGEQLKRP